MNATEVQATSGGSRKIGTDRSAAIASPMISPPSPATISAAGTRRSSASTVWTAVAVCRPRTPPSTNPVADPRTTPTIVLDVVGSLTCVPIV